MEGEAPKVLLRKFRLSNSFQDAISYLNTQESLLGKIWILRPSVGSKEFHKNEHDSFQRLGLVADTSLLIVLIEID